MPDAILVFRALADPTRRQILQELKDGELAAGDIVALFDISAPSISRHLSVLSNAGLVSSRRDANRILYQLEEAALAHALGDFLSSVCPTQIVQRQRRSSKATKVTKAAKRGRKKEKETR